MKLFTMPVGPIAAKSAASPGVVSRIWATEGNLARAVVAMHAEAAPGPERVEPQRKPALRVLITPETAFYRKYTEAMLRRYAVLALQKGRVPSLLGRELFGGNVSSCKLHTFDDAIHFVIDMDRCLKLLSPDQQKVVRRVAVQEYTMAEAAALMKWSHRTTERRYHESIDELTAILQKRGLMEKTPGLPGSGGAGCQVQSSRGVAVNYSADAASA